MGKTPYFDEQLALVPMRSATLALFYQHRRSSREVTR
jgi:hypothetical protein